jgi:hypothetical protein
MASEFKRTINFGFIIFIDEVKSLCTALLHFGLDSEASAVQNMLSALLKDTENKKASIWIPELAQNRAAALTVKLNFHGKISQELFVSNFRQWDQTAPQIQSLLSLRLTLWL